VGHDFSQYAPVGKAEAARMQAAEAARRVLGAPLPEAQVAPVVVVPPVAQPAPVAQPTPAPVVQPPPVAAPVFVNAAARTRRFPLDHPVLFEGRVFAEVHLRRPTSREVGQFFEELAEAIAADPGALVYFPVFADADGGLIPAAVLDIMDDDDRDPIMGAVADFLPRRLQALRGSAPPASPRAGGGDTAPTSST
jgi:hypothetical protein